MHRGRPAAKAPPRTKGRAHPNFGAAQGTWAHEAGGDGTRLVPPGGHVVARWMSPLTRVLGPTLLPLTKPQLGT